MKKRGAVHVDWVVSMGIFLIYILVLLVLIKPSYKPSFEEDILTDMVKDEFLEQNSVSAGFTVIVADGCGSADSNVDQMLREKLPTGIDENEIYIRYIPGGPYYEVLFLDGTVISDEDSINWKNSINLCEDIEIGEIFHYNGLKQKDDLGFDVDGFDFPGSRNYKINIYGLETEKSFGSEEEPSGDDKVYVLDWSGAILGWDGVNKEVTRENIIINIRVW